MIRYRMMISLLPTRFFFIVLLTSNHKFLFILVHSHSMIIVIDQKVSSTRIVIDERMHNPFLTRRRETDTKSTSRTRSYQFNVLHGSPISQEVAPPRRSPPATLRRVTVAHDGVSSGCAKELFREVCRDRGVFGW